jgi:hypothetical protein
MMIIMNTNNQISPFAGGPDFEIKFTYVSRNWSGVMKLWKESENRQRDKKLATLLNDVLLLTGIQMLQTGYFHESPNMAKRKINKLARAGYLLKHKIKRGNAEIPFYSVGPAAFIEDLSKEEYKHAFYRQFGITNVLKTLSVNQLYVKLMKNNYIKSETSVLPPYTARFRVLPKKHGNPVDNKEKIENYSIISIRNYDADTEEMKRQLPKNDDRAIVICASNKVLERIHSSIRHMDNYIYTTDQRLFSQPLSSAFLKSTPTGYEELSTEIFE